MACLLVCPLGCLLLEVFLLTCPLLAMDPELDPPRTLVKRGEFSAKVLNGPHLGAFPVPQEVPPPPHRAQGGKGLLQGRPRGSRSVRVLKGHRPLGWGRGGRQLKKKKKKKQEAEKANKKKTKKETGCLGSCREARWAQDVHVVG